ncbi:MAG: hypothetical protein EOO47_01155 [Flavobacterium sp.]|nr:MAG: hypothetical protein EOO47_01155 [Flavobacterium sp.]
MRNNFSRRLFMLAGVCVMLLLVSCVSRLRRPEITGVIVDYDKNPIPNCKVGEVLTDKNGRFKLVEQRYNAFLLSEILVMEAPPLMVFEQVEKEGFEKDAVSIFNSRGGGQRKGAKMSMDTIFLRKVNQAFDVSALLKNGNWKLGFTKQSDTIYLVKDGFEKWCKTDRCNNFRGKFGALIDNYHGAGKNLPEGMIRRSIDLKFGNEQSPVKINMICEYISTFDGPNRRPDTINTSGNYRVLNNSKMILNGGKVKSISGEFNISDVDLYQMKLIRLK